MLLSTPRQGTDMTGKLGGPDLPVFVEAGTQTPEVLQREAKRIKTRHFSPALFGLSIMSSEHFMSSQYYKY